MKKKERKETWEGDTCVKKRGEKMTQTENRKSAWWREKE